MTASLLALKAVTRVRAFMKVGLAGVRLLSSGFKPAVPVSDGAAFLRGRQLNPAAQSNRGVCEVKGMHCCMLNV